MKKILLVDDEPNIVMALDYALQKQGYEVFIARNGTEAIETANTQIPNIIVLDIMMPDIDGYETLKILKSNKKLNDTKIVFLSAKNKQSDIEKGMLLGADEYFTKPFSVKKLITYIKNND